jgi:TonB-dependent starch-binding outer membrane protein SusC
LRWQQPGDETKTNVPSLIYPGNPNRDNFYLASEATVRKADNIRLQFINLGYTLESNPLHKLPISNVQIYINASNPGILWKSNKENTDPDYGSGLPPSKQITIGLRSTF